MIDKFEIKDFANSAKELEKIIQINKKELEELLSLEDKTYENFVVPFQIMGEKLEVFLTPIFHLDSVCNSEETQKVYSECLPLISIYGTQLSQNDNIYRCLKDIQSKYKSTLNVEQLKVLENEIRDFELSGCQLNVSKKERLEKINLELGELSKEFSQNLLDATNAWEMICTEDEVKELPSSDLESSKFTDEKTNEVKYKFTLQMPSYISYITYGNSSARREEIYKAYCTRAPQNGKLIEQILKLKNEKANILGFDNYSAYSISTKMAKSEDEVISFLEKIANASKDGAIVELNEVKELAFKLDGVKDVNSFDLAYYSEKLKNEKYSIDEEYYKPYFEQNSTVDGLFDFLYKIFGIKFEQIVEKTWNEKVKVYNLLKEDDIVGKIYLDLEAREEKRGGAWMHNWHNNYDVCGNVQLPSAYVVCNFPASSKTQESLLRHSDVVTLFHEMGHAIHHLFTNVKEPLVSGINGVAWDTVEFPSQFLEYFSYEKKVLEIFAKHYKTKEVLPSEAIDKLIKSRNFQSALTTIRQIEFALFDFRLYQTLVDEKGVQDLLDNIRKDVSVIVPPSYNKFQNGFAHIFSGGYSAGYYSYKWAEVLSADAFYLFKENGIFNEELAFKYRDIILGKGGSMDMNQLFFDFAQRDASVDSLLKIDGIIS
ncbi:MAG TPA: M3 family peptidase [Arcobacter sp.]|nr:M3 family peptidase [Arcobacter sp.]HIP56376.1 M3 family peptidase [Arcobacter sp.]